MYEISIERKNSFLRKVFFQMFLGLFVTGMVSVLVVTNSQAISIVGRYVNLIIIGELALVLGINFAINKISNSTAKLMFVLYSVMNGLVLSFVILVYDIFSVIGILGITGLIFVGMSIYGLKTKEDLSTYSGFFKGGLITLIIVSIINIFLKINILGWLISVCAVVLFTALIAFDVNRISKIFLNSGLEEDELDKFSTIGALMLYLDFINLFLNLLRLFGKRK